LIKTLQLPEFQQLLQTLHQLQIYMQLHEPKLKVKSPKFLQYTTYNSDEQYCVGGFARPGQPCVILLPAVCISKNIAFQEMKAAVLLIEG